MPVIPINYLAVLVSAIANMVLGFLWFGPLFGKSWMALSGVSVPSPEQRKKMGPLYLLAFVAALIMAFVMAHALYFASTVLQVSGVSAGLQAGFWNWLGFVAVVTLGMVLWEGKSWKLWAIINGYWLVSLLVMGVILGVWQ